MKLKIEVEVKDSIDLEHLINSVTYAMDFSDNVTLDEFNLVYNVIESLITEKKKSLKDTVI